MRRGALVPVAFSLLPVSKGVNALVNELKEPNESQVENNQSPTAEDYEAIKAELEAEKAKAQTLADEATRPLQERISALEAELQAARDERQATSNELEGAKAAYAYAVEDFKKLAAAANPLLPPEVISGATIEEVKASIEKANKLVANVQESLSKQTQQASVPAGAPARTGPDVSSLSTKEKINLGLEQARKKKES
jgi:chromosome segregation ATPase